MATHHMFNSFNTVVGLLLTICAFVMQSKIDNVCGSKPLRNSILGILVIGIAMFWLGSASLYSGSEILTKDIFAGFVGILGITLIVLGSFIVQHSTKECKEDIVCNQISGKDKSSKPCEGARLWGGIVVAAGCIMIVGAGVHAFTATGADKMALDKMKDIKADMDVARSTKAAKAQRATQLAQKKKAQEIAAKGLRPDPKSLEVRRGLLRQTPPRAQKIKNESSSRSTVVSVPGTNTSIPGTSMTSQGGNNTMTTPGINVNTPGTDITQNFSLFPKFSNS